MCSQKNNVFVKNALVRQRRFLANSKAFFFLPSVFLSENKISVFNMHFSDVENVLNLLKIAEI